MLARPSLVLIHTDKTRQWKHQLLALCNICIRTIANRFWKLIAHGELSGRQLIHRWPSNREALIAITILNKKVKIWFSYLHGSRTQVLRQYGALNYNRCDSLFSGSLMPGCYGRKNLCTKHVLIFPNKQSKLITWSPGRSLSIFYLHDRLLERSAKVSDELGGGSAAPVIRACSISAAWSHWRTSLVNYLQCRYSSSHWWVHLSRVGGSAQIKAMRKLLVLRIDSASYRELKPS